MKIRGRVQENYVFLGLIVLVFVFGMYGLVKTPQKTSISENRSLTQFSHFTINNFLNGKFQDNFEKALSDQFAFSEKIRVSYGDAVNNLPTFGIGGMICKNRYIMLRSDKSSNALFNCDDYMVATPMKPGSSHYERIDTNIKKYNHVNSLVDTYYYFIDEPNVYDFSTGKKVIDIKQILREKLEGKYKMTSLHYDGYEDYTKYFYKTDHHLNNVGQLQAFNDITKLMGINNPAEPVGYVNNHEYFFGSRAKDSRDFSIEEEFIFNNYDIPEHDSFVNRVAGHREHFKEFVNHDYVYDKFRNYYGWVFGSDSGEVVLDFHQPKMDNLLIFINSFGKPMVVPLAQYYNKTFVVDLRHYKDDLKEDFEFSKYIKDNKIDKVLFIMSSRFIFDKNSNVGLEK